jgi:hypothetical protein
MSEATHTETPWFIESGSHVISLIDIQDIGRFTVPAGTIGQVKGEYNGSAYVIFDYPGSGNQCSHALVFYSSLKVVPSHARLVAENAALREALVSARLAIETLPADALGRDPELGYPYAHELLAKIDAALSSEKGQQ